ncbi:MAG: hypothetical protein JXR36_09510 [Bacteroidales bacterium]|nr:hypothetical protein [Bacteroidales bacterium]
MRHIIYFILISLIFSGCELIPDLERDNINDENYSGDKSALPIQITFKEVGYVFSYVTNSGSGFSPSSKTYVKIVLLNNCSFDLEDVTATVSTTNSHVLLSTADFPIHFSNYLGRFPSKEELQGKLLDSHNEPIPSPNTLPYSFYIEISSSATIGEQIMFTLNVTEKDNRTWSNKFFITIE